MNEQNTDVKSLAHTKWNCKYHVVFAPKYRRCFFKKNEKILEILLKHYVNGKVWT